MTSGLDGDRRGSGGSDTILEAESPLESGACRQHAHRIVNKPWGNTDPFRQCDGEYAGSNGTSLLITMGKM